MHRGRAAGIPSEAVFFRGSCLKTNLSDRGGDSRERSGTAQGGEDSSRKGEERQTSSKRRASYSKWNPTLTDQIRGKHYTPRNEDDGEKERRVRTLEHFLLVGEDLADLVEPGDFHFH